VLVDLGQLESWSRTAEAGLAFCRIRMESVDLAELVFCHTELGGQSAEELEPFWRHNRRKKVEVLDLGQEAVDWLESWSRTTEAEAGLVFCRIRTVLVDLGLEAVDWLESWSRTSEAEAGLAFCHIRMELVDQGQVESWSRTAEAGLAFYRIRMELADLEWLESWIRIRMGLVDLGRVESWSRTSEAEAGLVFCRRRSASVDPVVSCRMDYSVPVPVAGSNSDWGCQSLQ
jgi:hypothetical protein